MSIVKSSKRIYSKYTKRVLDIFTSLLAIIILSPLFIIVSIMVMLKLGTPIIFSQKRPGLNEKIFTIYKFRTMTEKRDPRGNLLPDNVRLTKFGHILRSTSLDELPELWNILRGDMSFVGPRPLLVKYLPLYTENQRRRHSIRPGLTGMAQSNGRNELSWYNRFRYDLEYIDKISFITDFKVVLKTMMTVLRREGISSEKSKTMETFTGCPDYIEEVENKR